MLAAFASSNLPSKYVKPQYIIMHPPPPQKKYITVVPRISSGYYSPKRTKEMFCILGGWGEGGGGAGTRYITV